MRSRSSALAVTAFVASLLASSSVAAVPPQSSPIAITPDDQVVVSVNPEANSLSAFDVTSDPPTKLGEIRVGREPNSVAVHPNGTVAYVANSAEGTVAVVDLTPLGVTGKVSVGVEPMALTLSPNATRLYVANSSSDTLTVLDTTTAMPSVIATIALSAFGTAPRAVGVTDDGDGDDTDETVFVALFFAQLRPGKGSVDEGQDDQREGHVTAISAATNTVLGAPNPIVLGPLGNTSFNSNGQLAPANGLIPAIASLNPQAFTTPTGAWPNQLAQVAIHPTTSQAYVVSTAASPNGPLRFNSMAQGLVSVYDTATRTEVTSGQTGAAVRQEAPLNLNRGTNFDVANDPRLFLTNPVAMAWRPDGSDAWVVIQNSDLLVRLTIDTNGVPTVGAPLTAGGMNQIVRLDLEDVNGGGIAGKAPRGIAINGAGTRAYVYNFVSQSITSVDISTPTAPAIAGTALASALPAPGSIDETALLGAELFFTGRGPDGRMSAESWGGCITCHPNGRSDNVTWMFEAGPRQTLPLDGTFRNHDLNGQRILNWSAVRDENQDFELNTRGVFGGRGLIDDDRLFLALGGTNGATPADSALVEQFQNATGVLGTTNDLAAGAALPALLGARRDFGVATLQDDRVFIIGGRSGSGQGSLITGANTILEFDPRTNVLTPRSSIGFTPRHSLGAAAVKTSGGPRIYAIGGYASTSGAALPVGTVEEYDPATDTWRTVATLPQATAQFGITVAGGVNTADPRELVHVVGGNAGSEATPSLVSAAFGVQRFQADPVGPGIWSSFNVTLLTTRRNHGAATALRGAASRIFVIGGQDAAGNVLDTVQEYTNAAVPAAVLTPHTSLPAPRARFGISSTLTTNQIYVVGGVDSSGTDQTSVFEYTTANNGPVAGPTGTPSGTWVLRANLSLARRGLGLSNPPGVTNFLPVANTGRDARQDAIATWIALKVRPSQAPVPGDDLNAIAGEALFNTVGLVIPGFSCASCHAGPTWTASLVDYTPPPSSTTGIGLGNEQVIGAELRTTATQPNTPGPVAPPQFPGVLLNVGTFAANSPGGRVNEIRFNAADVSQAIAPLGAAGFNIPSLLSVHETAPYFYSGLAQTLEEVLDGSQDGNGGVRHHFVTDLDDRADLIAYLRSIELTCGNGNVEGSEECDDGNSADGDGCSTGCVVEDADNDGVLDGVENGAPNGGDGNGDGIADSLQDTVASVPAATDATYMTIVTDCPLMDVAAMPLNAPGFELPFGGLSFRLPGCATSGVKILYHGVDSLDAPPFKYVKVGPNPPGAANNVVYTLSAGAPHNVMFGSAALTFDAAVGMVMFTLTDGVVGDDTGVDGDIHDQGGPGIPLRHEAPVLSSWALVALILALLVLPWRRIQQRLRV